MDSMAATCRSRAVKQSDPNESWDLLHRTHLIRRTLDRSSVLGMSISGRSQNQTAPTLLP